MALEVEINNSSDPAARYIANAPSPCRIRQTPGPGDVQVTLHSRPEQPGGGEAVLYAPGSLRSQPSLTLALPADGTWVAFGLGGKFRAASVQDRDCLLVVSGAGPEVTVPLMVRVRKNANELTPEERRRFVTALAALNNAGAGVYQDFRNIHVDASDLQAHRGPQFLPWHRAFLLDLERELQRVDPSVSLPYWRFDEPAPNVFRGDFMGATRRVPENGEEYPVVFDSGHPLAGWVTDGQPGIQRSAVFDTQKSAASGVVGFSMITQADTLDLGGKEDLYGLFARMEGQPHGAAHMSFVGPVSHPMTAVRDPLFFLLHANVDRLWALWQWDRRRMDPARLEVYIGQNFDGRRLGDTMWPWNGVKTDPRPGFAPGGPLPDSSITTAPGPVPTVRSMIDFEGHVSPPDRIATGYDDVPFEFE